MKKISSLFISVFCLLTTSLVFGAAQVRNVSVSGCYTPGQNITISFEVNATNASQNIYGDIDFSNNTFAAYTDDCVWDDAGPLDPPVTSGHNGGFMIAQGGDTGIWHPVSYTVKVPASYNTSKYLIVNVAENYMQLFIWGSHIENSANITVYECATPTFTNTPVPPTATSTPTGTFTALPSGTHIIDKILHVEYKNGSLRPNIINPFIRIYNDSAEPVSINGMEVRYWYKYDGVPKTENISIVNAVIQNSVPIDITSQSLGIIVNQIRGDQDRYLKITFNSAYFIEPGRYIEVQSTIAKADNSYYEQTNDWSYNAAFLNFTPWGRIPVYVPNIGVYGADPYKRNSPLILRVRCNPFPTGYTDSNSNYWEPSRPYAPGGWGKINNQSYWSMPGPIASTVDAELYYVVCESLPPANNQKMSYIFDGLSAGNYQVTLKFAEIFLANPAPGGRVFNVQIEGNTVLPNFDIFFECGYRTACDKTFTIKLTDGQLNIDFIPLVNDAIISAIEILEIPAAPTATPTFSPTPCFISSFGSTGNSDGQFLRPAGITLDSSGNIYVVDSGNNRIQKFDNTYKYITQWGSSGNGDGQFSNPTEMAIDSSGNIYVVDNGNNRIQKFNSAGVYITQWGGTGSGDGQFLGPNGIAIDSSGNVYVVDMGNSRIEEFTSSGTYITQWNGSGISGGGFYFPMGIVIDSAGNIYISDSNNYRILKFTSSMSYITQWGNKGPGLGQFFGRPLDMAIDSSGNIYVVDVDNRIQEFTSSGAPITQWGELGTGDGQFDYPWGITGDSAGYIYVTDLNNNRVEKFGPCPIPTPTPNLTVITAKDCAIDWLHAQQGVDFNGVATATPEYGAWSVSNTFSINYSDVGITALVLLALMNEYNYGYFTDFPTNSPGNWVVGNVLDDPAFLKGIEYIHRNLHMPSPGYITDLNHTAADRITYNYDTAMALATLCAYRKILIAKALPIPGWVEDAMYYAQQYLLSIQNTSVSTTDAIYGGWGYPLPNWADMSNTQFAIWGLKVAEVATDTFLGGTALTSHGGTLSFPSASKAAAGVYIIRSSEFPDTLANLNKDTRATDIGVIPTPNGSMYQTTGQDFRCIYTRNCHAYGSISAASLWSAYCLDAAWDPIPGNSSALAWNNVLWQKTNYISPPAQTTGNILNPELWYYYFIMSAMKAYHMNQVPPDAFAPTADWYSDFTNHLLSIAIPDLSPLHNYPCTEHWSNIGPNDSEEFDIFDTVSSILGIETELNVIAPSGTLAIFLQSPGEVYITDSKGLRAGCINGTVVTEIPGSNVPDCRTIHIQGTKDGLYTVTVHGTANGEYHIIAQSYLDGGLMQQDKGIGNITTGEIQTWHVSLGRVFWPMTLSTDFVHEILPTGTITMTPTITPTPTKTPYPIPTLEVTVNPRSGAMYTVYGPTPLVFPPDEMFGAPFLTVRYYFPFTTNPAGPLAFYFYMDPALSPYFMLTTDGASGACGEQTDGKSVTVTCSSISSPYYIEFFFNGRAESGLPLGVFHNTAYIAPDLTSTPQLVNMNFEIDVLAPTFTNTPTITFTNISTLTQTITPTITATVTQTITQTLTPTVTSTITNSVTPTSTSTRTITQTATSNVTRTATRTITLTITRTFTPTKTATPTQTMTITPTVASVANLRAQYFSYQTNPTNNTIYINVRIYNDDTKSVALSSVSAKYWYTFEGTNQTETAVVDWAGKQPSGQAITSNTLAAVNTISQSGQTRVEITTFNPNAGSIAPGEYAEFHVRVYKNDWSNYNMSNDYSFGTQTAFQNWQQVTLYYNGSKVWGLEPGQLGLLLVSKTTPIPAEPLSENNSYNFPNPCQDSTTIRFSLEKPADVNIGIYDLAGKKVWGKDLQSAATRAGVNYLTWNTVNDMDTLVANGIYVLKISADGKLVTKKVAVVR